MRALIWLCLGVRAARAAEPLGVLVMGSNGVDKFYRLRGAGGATDVMGAKGYFVADGEVIGGVTLNHLSWAAALGVPTALAAVQGEDEPGRSTRSAMAAHGISDGGLSVRGNVSSSVSHVLLKENGERTILMAPHATATLDKAEVEASFANSAVLDRVRFVTTKVSQVPLSGVSALVDAATLRGIPTILDVDVPPSIAAGEAQLCESPKDVFELAKAATVLKTTRAAAAEMLSSIGYKAPKSEKDFDPLTAPLEDVAFKLLYVTRVRLVAVTDGLKGGALASTTARVALPPPPTGVSDDELDTTGAGDAFFGGLIAVLWHRGLGLQEHRAPGETMSEAHKAALPREEADLVHTLHVANAVGTAGCKVLGGLPPADGSGRARALAMIGDETIAATWLPPPKGAAKEAAAEAPPKGAAKEAAAEGEQAKAGGAAKEAAAEGVQARGEQVENEQVEATAEGDQAEGGCAADAVGGRALARKEATPISSLNHLAEGQI